MVMTRQSASVALPPSVPATPEISDNAVAGCGTGNVAIGGRPGGVATAADGAVFVSLPSSGSILRVGAGRTTVLSTRSTGGTAGDIGKPLLTPTGLAVAPDGTLFVADTAGHRIWAIARTGDRRVLAGSAYGFRDGPAEEALFRYPTDVAIAPDGTCYVADGGNHRIRTISPEGVVATLAGSIYDYGDGRGPAGRFRQPLALDVDADGTCYVADTGNNAIRRVSSSGEVTTVAGYPPGGDADGTGPEVGLRWPSGIAVGRDGHVWVADYGNRAIRLIERTGPSTTTLRLDGRRWPVAVASGPDDGVVVSAELLDAERHSQTCLISSGAGR